MPPDNQGNDAAEAADVPQHKKRKRDHDETESRKKNSSTAEPVVDARGSISADESDNEAAEGVVTDESIESGSLDIDSSQGEDNDGEEEMYDQSQSEDFDEFAHFPWLKPIKVEIKAEDGPHEQSVGWCYAKVIDREPI